jgi:chromosome partitioning protein
MLQGAPVALPPGAPHVIVVGNEKGGAGKTTMAMHVAVGLLKLGQRVSTIDLDSTQQSLTRYTENRRIWANYRRIELELPAHRYVSRARSPRPVENEPEELAALETAISSFDRSTDFLVIDTPSNDTYLMRLAHLMADTVLTPLPDSFLDFGMLASIDPITHEVTGTGPYAAMMCEARRRRRQVDGALIDWVVVRNRFSLSWLLGQSLGKLAMRLGFRDIEGCAERVVYRQFFLSGLTAFDPLDEITLGDRPNWLHVAAQHEMRDLITQLKLPINELGRRRAAIRAKWAASAAAPLETSDILAD